MSPEQFSKVREYEAGVHDLLRDSIAGKKTKTLAEELEEVKEEDLEMSEAEFEVMGDEIDQLEAEGREVGQRLRWISYEVSKRKDAREEYCREKLGGHEWDDENGMSCMICQAVNDNEPDDYYPEID